MASGALAMAQFGPVAAPELVESFGVVPVPLAKVSRRGGLFAPLVEGRFVLADAAGPEPIDEDPGPVARLGLLIDSTHPYRTGAHTYLPSLPGSASLRV